MTIIRTYYNQFKTKKKLWSVRASARLISKDSIASFGVHLLALSKYAWCL
jgi:hypothetical protein